MRSQEILLSIIKRLPLTEFSPKMYVEINEVADIGESLFNTNINLRINSDKFYLRGWSENMTKIPDSAYPVLYVMEEESIIEARNKGANLLSEVKICTNIQIGILDYYHSDCACKPSYIGHRSGRSPMQIERDTQAELIKILLLFQGISNNNLLDTMSIKYEIYQHFGYGSNLYGAFTNIKHCRTECTEPITLGPDIPITENLMVCC
jgi:hypothetical protein